MHKSFLGVANGYFLDISRHLAHWVSIFILYNLRRYWLIGYSFSIKFQLCEPNSLIN